MKYQATDSDGKAIEGALFKDEFECTRYEQDLERDRQLQAEAAKFLDMKDWPEDPKAAKRERTKWENAIHAWLAYDARQRPERYEESPDRTPEETEEAAIVRMAVE